MLIDCLITSYSRRIEAADHFTQWNIVQARRACPLPLQEATSREMLPKTARDADQGVNPKARCMKASIVTTARSPLSVEHTGDTATP